MSVSLRSALGGTGVAQGRIPLRNRSSYSLDVSLKIVVRGNCGAGTLKHQTACRRIGRLCGIPRPDTLASIICVQAVVIPRSFSHKIRVYFTILQLLGCCLPVEVKRAYA